jgi:hypothetical protein
VFAQLILMEKLNANIDYSNNIFWFLVWSFFVLDNFLRLCGFMIFSLFLGLHICSTDHWKKRTYSDSILVITKDAYEIVKPSHIKIRTCSTGINTKQSNYKHNYFIKVSIRLIDGVKKEKLWEKFGQSVGSSAVSPQYLVKFGDFFHFGIWQRGAAATEQRIQRMHRARLWLI